MKTIVPFFGTSGWSPATLGSHKIFTDTKKMYSSIEVSAPDKIAYFYPVKIVLTSECPYDSMPQKAAAFGSRDANAFTEAFNRSMPQLVEEVDKRMTARMEKQTFDIATKISNSEQAVLAKKSSSIVTLNGSILGFGKITEAWTKTIELLQGAGKAWKSGTSPTTSNVDNASFPRQIGRAALNGAKGSLKITAGGLGAAVVMSALLATSGIALNKMHDAFPSVPSASGIVSTVVGHVEKLKVSVGSVEVERAGSPAAKVLSLSERATGLLAQNNNDYGKTINSVNAVLSMSYVDGKYEAIEAQKKLLEQLRTMQAAQTPVTTVGKATPTVSVGPVF